MAVTLAQVLKLEDNPLKKMIYTNMLRDAPILEYLPFENVNALTSVAIRWTNLPSVAFRRINADYTESEGDVEQVYESVYGFGGKIRIDRVFDKIQGSLIKDPEQLQIEMMSKVMAITFNNYFLNGDHATDVDGFEGLKKRISNMPTRQTVQLGAASADAYDPTSSTANARGFIDDFEEAYYKANGGSPDAILMNEGVKWGFGKVLRYLGVAGYSSQLDSTKDRFDREILSYKGTPFVDAGLLADQTTEIITDTETDAKGDSSDTTSVYFVPFNDEHGIIGIQLSDMEEFPGENDEATNRVTVVEWWAGLAGFGSYGPVRLWNLEAPGSWT